LRAKVVVEADLMKNNTRALLPVLSLGTFSLILAFFHTVLGYGEEEAPDPCAAERFVWACSLVAYTFTIVVSIAASLGIASRSIVNGVFIRRLMIVALIVSLLLTTWACIRGPGTEFSGWAAGFGGRTPIQDVLASTITTANTYLVWTAMVLTACVSHLLARAASSAQERQLGEVVRAFRVSLAVSTIMLTAAVIHTASLYRWGAAVWGIDRHLTWANSVTAGSGMIFTSTLLACFTPVAMLLNRRHDQLLQIAAREQGETFDVARWRAAHDLAGPPTGIFQETLAAAAPLLVGMMSGFFDGKS
jgi:hypothetical protein